MFHELEITPQRALKVCIIGRQTLDPFTGFFRMHQDKLRQNPNESYHTASQKKKLKKRNCRNELIRQFTVKSRKMLRARKGKRDQVVGICVSERQHLVIQESIEFSKTITLVVGA